MTNPVDPNEAFYKLRNGRTNAEKNAFQPMQPIHKNTPNTYLIYPKQMAKAFGIPDDYDEIARELGFDHLGVMSVANKEELYEAQDIWQSNEVWEHFQRAPGGKRQHRGAEYNNYSDQAINPKIGAINVETGEYVETGPASFDADLVDDIEVPTATSNPERPRTVAAAFEDGRSVITVVFRDGTIYNYYNCTRELWDNFKAATNKGQFILTDLDSLPRGPANMSQIPEELRIIAYGRFRGEQVRQAKAGGWKPRTRVRYYDMNKAIANGKNPADYQMVRRKSKGFK